MAKRKGGLADDLIGIAASLPWWGGILLAGISYVGFHVLASMGVSQAGGISGLGAFGAMSIFKTFAMILQYLVPIAFLIGALVSVLSRQKRDRLLNDAASSEADALNGMSWQEFEMLVGEAYRRQGFDVKEIGGGGADGGIDLVLTKNGKTVLVQCKQWKAFKVGVKVVRELYGVMAAQNAKGGVVVTSGVFTQEAKDFADGKNINLMDGDKLRRVIESVRSKPVAAQPTEIATKMVEASPMCPKCGGGMVKRVAKQGGSAGRSFWGCESYPRCRGIVAIREA